MSRHVKEWLAKTDDAAIPPRVKDRIFKRCGEQCQNCSKPLNGRNKPEFDHITALVNGGNHRETNLQALCAPCHGAKSKIDVAEKSKVHESRVRNLGLAAPRQKIRSAPFRKSAPQKSASRPVERRSYSGE